MALPFNKTGSLLKERTVRTHLKARAEKGRLRRSFVPVKELLEAYRFFLGRQLRNVDLILLAVVWFKYFQTEKLEPVGKGREV